MTQQPTLEATLVGHLSVAIAPPVDLGSNSAGRRRFVPITGGTLTGAWRSGHVRPGGGDWQTIRPDGVVDLRAQYVLELDDASLIEIDNRGLRHAPPAVADRLAAGAPVSPDEYYFRTAARLHTAAPEHDWLNRTVFVGNAARHADRVEIDLFAIGPLIGSPA
ncbi:DUF3237 domain-containing protein [Salinisphaera sp. Q1T1-3]|uniref:DUF3237 domain-containing protein n=1 Tax=Salinisphaera sp. Q1T1-3 TaxID=2321229 RepID=UPI0013148C71|nr:DUF3237 domain-containing protein [Salinisphaera sp. Q1T1-3]